MRFSNREAGMPKLSREHAATHHFVDAAGREEAAVRRKYGACDGALVAVERVEQLPLPQIVQLHRAVRARRREIACVEIKSQPPHEA